MLKIRKIVSGIGVDTVGTILSMGISIAVIPIFFQYISKGDYGLWLAINSLVGLVALVDLGVEQYLTRIVSDDEKFISNSINDYISSVIRIKIFIAFLFLMAATIGYFFLQKALNISSEMMAGVSKTYLLTLTSLILSLFVGVLISILYGRHEIAFTNTVSSGVLIFTNLLTVVFLYYEYGLISFPLGLLIATSLQLTILYFFIHKKYPHIVRIKLTKKLTNPKEMINYSFSFQVLKWAYILRSQCLILVINGLVGPVATALYNITNRLPQLGVLFASKVATPFFPSFTLYFERNNIKELAEIFTKINKLLFRFSLFISIIVLVVNESFILLWVGDNSFAGNNILYVLCILCFVNGGMSSFGVIVYSSKEFKKWPIFSLLEIFIGMILSYMLFHSLGLLGVLLGFGSVALANQAYLFLCVLKQLNINPIYFINSVLLYVIRTNFITIIYGFIVYEYYKINNWINLSLVVLSFFIVHLFGNEGVKMVLSKEISLKRKLISAIYNNLDENI